MKSVFSAFISGSHNKSDQQDKMMIMRAKVPWDKREKEHKI